MFYNIMCLIKFTFVNLRRGNLAHISAKISRGRPSSCQLLADGLMADKSGLAGARGRYTGTTAELTAILKKYITGPGDIQYGTDAGCPIEQAKLKHYSALLRDLQALMPKMSFSVSQLKAALVPVAKPRSFGLAAKDRADFRKTCAQRIICMCGHVMKAARRVKPPAWVAEVMDNKLSVADMLATAPSSRSAAAVPAAEEPAAVPAAEDSVPETPRDPPSSDLEVEEQQQCDSDHDPWMSMARRCSA